MSSCRILAAAFAVLLAVALPASATIATCPAGSIANTFASPQFGANAEICGNVSVLGNTLTLVSPQGAQPLSALQPWLPNITKSYEGFSVLGGSAFQFAVSNLTITVPGGQEIPEPGTIGLMAIGLLALTYAARKRQA